MLQDFDMYPQYKLVKCNVTHDGKVMVPHIIATEYTVSSVVGNDTTSCLKGWLGCPSESCFLAALLCLIWDSALLYWDIPEANLFVWLKMAYFRLFKQVRGFLNITSVLRYANCSAITVFVCYFFLVEYVHRCQTLRFYLKSHK